VYRYESKLLFVIFDMQLHNRYEEVVEGEDVEVLPTVESLEELSQRELEDDGDDLGTEDA